jgi:hypothetical protein
MVILLLAAIAACRDERLSRPIEAWLLCDECVDGERAAVRALGDQAVPELARALLDGPPEVSRDVVRHQSITAHSRAGVGTLSGNQYATQMVDNYVAKYQERAAVSLGDIRTASAKSALDQALQLPRRSRYRADVWRAIRAARMAIDATSFGGKFDRSVLDFGDTAFLLAPPARPFTRNDMVTFDDMAFPPGDLFLSQRSDRLGFAAAGAPGSHLIAVRTLGTGRTEVASFFITSITDGNDRATRNCPDRACEISRSPIIAGAALPYNSFLSLRSMPPRPDSVDMFRFMPSSLLRVSAELDWSGPGDLDLLWRSCGQFTPVGNSDGATTTKKPERTSVDIPGGACWLLLVTLKTRLPEPTFAHLRVKSP